MNERKKTEIYQSLIVISAKVKFCPVSIIETYLLNQIKTNENTDEHVPTFPHI